MNISWLVSRWLRRAVVTVATCSTLGSAAAQRPQPGHDSTGIVGGPPPAQAPLVFTGVSVVDVTRGRLLRKRIVVVAGNRIRAVGPASTARIPNGARVIDAKGKYLIPGLWDMHAHIDQRADQLYPRFIAHGITGVREMAQRFPFGVDSFRVWQREVMAGTRVGPRIVGPSADYPAHFATTKPQDVLRVIDSLKAAGTAFLKYHDDFGDRDLFFAMAREARRVGLPMVGHVPMSVTNAEAADSGLRSIEHINEHRQCWVNYPWPLGDSAATEQRCAPEIRAYIRDGTWLVPTFATFWPEPAPHKQSASLFKDALRMVRMMRRFGVRNFLAGTDWAIQYNEEWEPQFLPGLSAAEEVVFFGEAGFTPVEALQTATLNPATFFHATDSLGAVEVGKLADMVLLDADPLADIHNVLKVRAVIANGRYFDRAALDSLDPVGTKPGAGLVALEQARKRAYSAQFVASTDTTELPLTEDLLARYIALRNDLRAFWPQHPALHDSAMAYQDSPVIGLGAKSEGRLFKQVSIFDYVALVARDSALAAVFRKNNFAPEQYWSVGITVTKAVMRLSRNVAGPDSPAASDTAGNVVAKNMRVVEAREADLSALGLSFGQPRVSPALTGSVP